MAQSKQIDSQTSRMSLPVLVAAALLLVAGSAPPAWAQGSVPGLSVGKLSIKLSFSAGGKDSIALQGTLPVPAGFVAEGRKIVVDVGGVVKSFTLDAKGKAKTTTEQLLLKVKATKGVVEAQDAKMTAKFAKGSFSSLLADEGLTNATVSAVPVLITVSVAVDDNPTPPSVVVQQTYTATKGKTGRAK